MKTIKLTQGQSVLVDDLDYKYLNQFKWYPSIQKNTTYAIRNSKVNGKWITIRMHREIMNTSKGMLTDHKDSDGLNNQRSNLRECSISENSRNKRPYGISKYLGVSWHPGSAKWMSAIQVNGKRKSLGYFDNEIEAAIMYNIAARKYYGEFANPNKF